MHMIDFVRTPFFSHILCNRAFFIIVQLSFDFGLMRELRGAAPFAASLLSDLLGVHKCLSRINLHSP